jgi:hypothetical protein
MKLLSLLDLLWSNAPGYRCVMSKRGSGRVRHDFYTDNAQAYARANALATEGSDVWFAPALLSAERRLQENVQSIGAVWVDIDAGTEGHKAATSYKDLDEVNAALFDFANRVALPAPYIVQSGNGLHLYWLLAEHVSRDTWQRLADGLRNACVKLDLKADHSSTIDSVRVLRVPGTFNYKDPANPKPVVLVSEGETCSVETVQDAIAPYKAALTTKKEAKKVNAKFAVDLPSLPKDANKIADACAQMRLMRETRGNIPEPQWYAGLGVLALCERGEELAHEWSKGYANYRPTETADKYERSKEFAPTTCSRFESVMPELCRACPHHNRIASPVQLGEYVQPKVIRVERVEAEGSANTELPVPRHYEVGEQGVFFTPPKQKDDDEDEARKLIIFNPLWVSRVMLSESNGDSEVEIVFITPRGKQRTASFKQELLARPTDLNAWLKSFNISIAPRAIEQVVFYLQAAINLINREYDEETVYDRFGWHQSGFIVGTERVHNEGVSPARISESVDKRRLIRLGTKGDVANWSGATRLLDQNHFWMHRFTVCAMLSSPLLRLSDSEGSVLSLSGESSGGKTTAASFGISAFGHPKAMTINPMSTENAFYEFWRLMSNLPVLCNEAATMDEKKLSNVVYAAANGEARDRLQRDGKMKEAGNFATVTCLTNNTHLLALPDRVLNEATRRRILEITFNKENVMPLTIGTELNRVMREHYGVAGRVFLQYVIANRDAVEGRIVERTAALEKGIDSANRYNVWLVAAASVAYEIAFTLGLLQFQFADALKNVLDIIRTQDSQIVSTVQKVQEAITRYLQMYQGFITQKHNGKSGQWIGEVRGDVRARYTIEADRTFTLCLPLKQFQEWALEYNIDINHIRQWSKESNITMKPERIAPKTDAVTCFIIPGFTMEDYEGEGIK